MSHSPLSLHLPAWRARRGLTQGQLAELAGVGASAINHIEAGRRSPSISVFARICAALDLSEAEKAEALSGMVGDEAEDEA